MRIGYSCILLLLCGAQFLQAQPYIDVASAKYQYSPDAGVFRRSHQPNHFTYGNIGVNAPLVFKDSSVMLFGLVLEKWHLKSNALPEIKPRITGLAVPLAFIKPLASKWTAALTVIPRFDTYSDALILFGTGLQWGGAVLMTYKKTPQLKYKFGLYYNREYFGHFFVPLVGIDWKINNRLQLFGVLPGNLVLERKVSRSFYYGVSFRSITNSYKYDTYNFLDFDEKQFLRIDDNQLQAFGDVYLTKNVVLNIEAGHSFFRRLRTGIRKGESKYAVNKKTNDNFLLRTGLAYRLRFD